MIYKCKKNEKKLKYLTWSIIVKTLVAEPPAKAICSMLGNSCPRDIIDVIMIMID